MTTHNEPIATPPDDGGHQGAHTRPEDTLESPATTDSRDAPPHLHWDTARGRGERKTTIAASAAAIIVVVIAALVAVIMYVYLRPM